MTDEEREQLRKALLWDALHERQSYGGKKAAENMTEKQRRKRAIKAAKARWKK